MKKLKVSFLILSLIATGIMLVGCNNAENQETSKQDELSEAQKESSIENSEQSIVSENDEQSDKQSEVSTEVSNESSIVIDPVSASWFDDAVIVGDSITLKLSYYCDGNEEALGKAQFFCSGSLGWANAQLDIDDSNAVHPVYKGETVLVENCAKATGANKVFISLGMNDIGLYGVDGTIENAEKLIDKIYSNSPDVEIYIESVTPIYKDKQFDTWNNTLVSEFNEKLEVLATEKNCKYLDIYPVFADEEGNLMEEYCSDIEVMGIHFTNEACEKWVEYLKNHVK